MKFPLAPKLDDVGLAKCALLEEQDKIFIPGYYCELSMTSSVKKTGKWRSSYMLDKFKPGFRKIA